VGAWSLMAPKPCSPCASQVPLRAARADVRTVIDTGFTGHITLPARTVSSLALPELGSEELLLADGTTEIATAHCATVEWHDSPRPVPALAVGTEPLIAWPCWRVAAS
jgi:predicted aspartyl protease